VLERADESVLDRLFGQVEVSDGTDQPREDAARFLAKDAVDGIERRWTRASDARRC